MTDTTLSKRQAFDLKGFMRTPASGPFIALLVAILIFGMTTDTFFTSGNITLVLSQTVVVSVLALGQTFIILTRGIDLANGSIAVMGTIVIAKLSASGAPALLCIAVGIITCMLMSLVSGLLVTTLDLPPFIVSLGLLTVYSAASKLFSESQSYRVTDSTIRSVGTGVKMGGFVVTASVLVMLALFALSWYLLTKTAWGRHVYAIGDNPEGARLTGIKVKRTILSVYVLAGLLYGIGAWLALGRIPNADTNAYQSVNLDSITAVVIGGTSLFGGRGGVIGTLLGALLVTVLRNGLTQAGIDSLYQDVATGLLVIVAVTIDRFARRIK